LVKGDGEALFLAPDHAAGTVSTIGLERELGRDSELARDIERSAGLGNVSDCAIDRAAAEMNAAAFQHAMPVCDPVFLVHPLKSQNVAIPAFRLPPGNDQAAKAIVDDLFTSGSSCSRRLARLDSTIA